MRDTDPNSLQTEAFEAQQHPLGVNAAQSG